VKAVWDRGDFFIWLTGAALALSLIMVTGLLGIVFKNGLGYFFPEKVYQYKLNDGRSLFVQEKETEAIPGSGKEGSIEERWRTKVKKGNRDIDGIDYLWIDIDSIKSKKNVPTATVIERLEWGNFHGKVQEVNFVDKPPVVGEEKAWNYLNELIPFILEKREEIHEIEKSDIGRISNKIEDIRLHLRKLELSGDLTQKDKSEADKLLTELRLKNDQFEKQLTTLRERLKGYVLVRVSDKVEQKIQLSQLVRVYRPNTFSFFDKILFSFSKAREFIFDDPRESNTEGGVFPAIFGTVMMVVVMSLFAAPLGILAAFYLREYAKPGPFVSIVRIAVNNLAGVPSIVFGVFGVGFFIYTLGGSIDQLFFPERLPTPTFGTGGILWASLTLALLTVPVVIVSTEEGLAAVPPGIREASLALGCTKAETIFKAVFPAVMPSILTGLILAMARAAGEVAPLMITGVVKIAPSLPVDAVWPFVHLERKFMHLGFHIYDVGFQSPNVDASRPMVFTTTLLLIGIVILLNIAAIIMRNRLRKKLSAGGF
jgi:phosphate transport system permease protein